MAPLCREFNIARKTGYQIWQRYKRFGQEAFIEQKRMPYRYANKLPVQLEMPIRPNCSRQTENLSATSWPLLMGMSREQVTGDNGLILA